MSKRLEDKLGGVQVDYRFVFKKPAEVPKMRIAVPALLEVQYSQNDLLRERTVSVPIAGEQAMRVPDAWMWLMLIRLEWAADQTYFWIVAAFEVAGPEVEQIS